MNWLIRDEQGQAFVLVLIWLLVGSLVVSPLLSFMVTSLKSVQVYNNRMDELYAADAGVEDALWKIKTAAVELPGDGDDPWEYSIANVNDKQVNYFIGYINDTTYKITSTAVSDSGSSTTIESYVVIPNFLYLLDHAITSLNDITIQPGSEVTGDVQYNRELDNKGDIYGELITDEIENWPTAEQFSELYMGDVAHLPPYPNDTIDLKYSDSIPRLYRDGDLEINNTGSQKTVPLEGTVYVTGDLVFKQPGGPSAYTIDLSGQTIFVAGNITFPAQRVTLSGPGCIIAIGDVTFQPDISSDAEFIFVMSIEGEVWFSPQSDFYGAVAGATHVDLQPNSSLLWAQYPDDLKFPGVDGIGISDLTIRNWEISLEQS